MELLKTRKKFVVLRHMKKIYGLILLGLGVAPAYAQHSHTPLTTEIDSVSYAVGMNIASSLKAGGIDTLNYEVFKEALKDVIEYDHTNMDGAASNAVVNAYVAKAKEKQLGAVTAEGTAFLAANATKKGVKVLPNGLQYKVITEGNGLKPIDGQTVKTHYKGTLINGKQFDSSYDRGQPASFNVNQVIPGWTQALKMMPVGSKWELYIPQELAYGERAMGANIPAYSTLIFTIELLEIVQ
ncbi:MAG: FKBP-type peptidyl-prolyl cis-trans isomerase FklB [Paracoccaceae bacterium]|jgi:FKBP-type peptidyl-prolyl cis-trans isomerase FklB